jgi:FkbM family methyltransferase
MGQDRWVAEVLQHKRGGYYLDFGAFDGVLTSNSLFLERSLGWEGICVEANPTTYPVLCRERRCITVNAALWSESRQSVEILDAHGLSSIVTFADHDSVGDLRRSITLRRINVDTINPMDLLTRFNVPELIDYLSLDIEGCELNVLKAMDLKRYKIALMTVEHASIPDRKAAVRDMLLPLGYQFVDYGCDDWFYHLDHLRDLTHGLGFSDPVEILSKVKASFPLKGFGEDSSQAPLPEDFDPDAYLDANPDVAIVGMAPDYHYRTFGRQENRPLRRG